MCGLWGCYSSILTKEDREFALFLGFLSQTRGMDSTGLAVLGKKKKDKLRLKTHREVTNATNFLNSKKASEVMDVNNPMLMMGHCRAATLGAVNERNAHPIEEAHIILCHNGSIPHFHDYKRDEVHSDSRELAQRIRDKGDIQAFREANNSPFAVTWIDFKTRRFNIIRNGFRPLFMVRSKSNTIFWASEYWMLMALLNKEGSHKFNNVSMLDTSTRYSWHLGTMQEAVEKIELDPPIRVLLCGTCGKGKAWCECKTSVPLIPDKRTHIFEYPSKSDSFFRGYLYKGWDGAGYRVSEVWNKLSREGCANCKKPCSLKETVKWVDKDTFFCIDCWENVPLIKNHLIGSLETYDSELIKLEETRH